MEILFVAVILFLMGFLPELLLLNLDDWLKLLGLAYPVAALIAAGYLLLGAGTAVCGMPALVLLIMAAPFFAGIAAAVVLWLIVFLIKKLSKE